MALSSESVPYGVEKDTPDPRRNCADCSTIERALMAPRPNVGHGYTGPMYCMECNPRFRFLDVVHSGLERMGS